MATYFHWPNFNRTPKILWSPTKKSGPFNNVLFNDSLLVLAPASKTILILSGLFTFLTGW